MTESNGTSKRNPGFPDDVIAVYADGIIKGKIHVLILNDDGSWFAHGIEADYSTEGTSLDDVRDRFAVGFADTIRAYLKRDGNIFGAFRPASDEYRKLYNEQTRQWFFTFRKKLDIASEATPSDEVQVVSREKIRSAKPESKPVAELDLEFSTACIPAGCGT